MKALSIQNPWAWTIAYGHKPLENRNWNTKFRGTFLIHAGQKVDEDAYQFLHSQMHDCWAATPLPQDLPCGGIIGAADLTHVVRISEKAHLTERDKPWFFGEYGFILDNARPLPFVPYKGRLGFFDIPYDLENQCLIEGAP